MQQIREDVRAIKVMLEHMDAAISGSGQNDGLLKRVGRLERDRNIVYGMVLSIWAVATGLLDKVVERLHT